MSNDYDPFADEEWLSDKSPRTWQMGTSYAEGGIYRSHWEANLVEADCEPCAMWARAITLLRAHIDVFVQDDLRLAFLEGEYPGHRSAEISAARAKIAKLIISTRVSVSQYVKRLIECRIEECGMDVSEAIQGLGDFTDGVPNPDGVYPDADLDDAEGEALLPESGVETEVEPIGVPAFSTSDDVCEPCLPYHDALRVAQRRFAALDDAFLAGKFRDPEELEAAEAAVARARRMLEACSTFLCDPPTDDHRQGDQPYNATGATDYALADSLRPKSNCPACQGLCDEIYFVRTKLRSEVGYAARLQRLVDDRHTPAYDIASLSADVDRHLQNSERFEQEIADLLELLAHCETHYCPDVETGAATEPQHEPDDPAIVAMPSGPGSVKIVQPGGPAAQDASPDEEVEPATEDEIKAWRSGLEVPVDRREAARQVGWLGPTRGWPRDAVMNQAMHRDHMRARFAAHDALRAYGFDVDGFLMFLPESCRRDPDPKSLEKHRTVLRFPVDQHARPIDLTQPLWMRRDQIIAGWFILDLSYYEWEQRDDELDPESPVRDYSGWSASLRVWDSRRHLPRIISAGNHDTDDRSTYRTSVLDAVYQALLSVTKGDRELRAAHRLGRTTDPDPVWDDSTGFSSDDDGEDWTPEQKAAYAQAQDDKKFDQLDGEYEPPEVDMGGLGDDYPADDADADDRPGETKHSLPIIVAGVVVAVIAIVIGVVTLSGGDPETDPVVDGTANEGADDTESDEGEVDAAPDLTEQQAIVARFGGPDGAAAFLVVEHDEDDDTTFSIVGVDGKPLPASQIDEVWSAIIRLASTRVNRLLNASAFPCGADTGEYRVTCPIGAGPAPDGEFVIIGVELAGPIGEGARGFTYGLALDDAEDDTDYAAPPEFDADFFTGTEFWYRLEIDADGNRQMRADGFIDGAPDHPRHSAAAVIEFADTLVWFIPRSELPDGPLSYRATAFHNDGDPGEIPNPATSGGDISGSSIDDPLLPISSEAVDFDADAGIPPDVSGTQPRTPIDGDPGEHLTKILLNDFFSRLDAALTAGDRDGVIATVIPTLVAGPNAEACIAQLEASLLQAESVTMVADAPGPDVTNGIPLYTAHAQITYPTGAVEWGPLLVPGPGGRLFQVLGCA